MSDPSKVMIIAPFWGNPQNVGVYRVDRFIRWLYAKGIKIVLIRAGSKDNVKNTSWGIEITVREPFGLYVDKTENGVYIPPQLKPNRLRRLMSIILFNPDPLVVWARRVVNHPLVVEHGQGINFIISSSPPESAHVASYKLSKKLKADLVIDMRDNWLDEPLKPLLKTSRIQRWREGRLEKLILGKAKRIFVVSDVLKSMLEKRLQFTNGKVTVLTNAYSSVSMQKEEIEKKDIDAENITLLYAGRFTASRNTQKVKYLLEPVLIGAKNSTIKGIIRLLGKLEPQDLEEVNYWKPQFESTGWKIEVCPPVSREEAIKQMYQVDGLLLLSSLQGVMTSKFFEYLPTRKPILILTPENSALWRTCKNLPQVFLLDYFQRQNAVSMVNNFIKTCSEKNYKYEIPIDFTEERLSQIFLEAVGVK